MTTLKKRTRRTKSKQAEDILRALLKTLEASTAKSKAKYDANLAAEASTRRAVEALNQEQLPGFDAPRESPRDDVWNPRSLATTSDERFMINPVEKQSIDDVWNPRSLATTVHTALMYSREDKCEWCRSGVPFVSEARTEHFVLTDGIGHGPFFKICRGAIA